MEIGALDARESVPDKKVALIVGMQWFFDDGCTTEAFVNSFSSEAHQVCMDNSRISLETKNALSQRATELGADVSLVSSSPLKNGDATLDSAIDDFLNTGAKRKALLLSSEDNTPIPPSRFEGKVEKPDWEKWSALEQREELRHVPTMSTECMTNTIRSISLRGSPMLRHLPLSLILTTAKKSLLIFAVSSGLQRMRYRAFDNRDAG